MYYSSLYYYSVAINQDTPFSNYMVSRHYSCKVLTILGHTEIVGMLSPLEKGTTVAG